MRSFGLVFLSEQLSIPQWDVLCWTWRVLRISQRHKLINRSGYPKKHVIFAMSERKPAYPAHALDMREDEDEDDKPHVRPTTRQEPLEEGRDQVIVNEDFAPVAFETSWDRTATEEKMAGSNCCTGTTGVKGLARARRGDLDFGQKGRRWSTPKHYQQVRCLTSITWGSFTWNTTTCPPRSSRKGPLIWTSLEEFMTSINTWWRHAHSAVQ